MRYTCSRHHAPTCTSFLYTMCCSHVLDCSCCVTMCHSLGCAPGSRYGGHGARVTSASADTWSSIRMRMRMLGRSLAAKGCRRTCVNQGVQYACAAVGAACCMLSSCTAAQARSVCCQLDAKPSNGVCDSTRLCVPAPAAHPLVCACRVTSGDTGQALQCIKAVRHRAAAVKGAAVQGCLGRRESNLHSGGYPALLARIGAALIFELTFAEP